MTAGSGVQAMKADLEAKATEAKLDAKFNINTIALGNLRRRRGRYLLLITGIVLAIYFVATALLFADSMFVSLRERHYSRMGEQDVIIFDCGEAPLEELAATGLLAEYGIAEILGYVLPDGQRQDNGFSIARFDATALALARKEPLEGRLPERAGEIALERSALARLRSSAGVGDTITLTLLIPDGSGFMAAPLQKRYTLVGILTDKLIYLDRWKTAHPAYRDYPAGVLSMEEQIEPGGRAVINCYGRYAGEAGATFERLQAFFAQGEAPDVFAWWEKLEHTGFRPFDNDFDGADSGIVVTSLFFAIIALVLVCAACLGIVNAFTADLEARKRQIGLLRAVGAMQGQIRTIFGRETLLLSLFSVPPALALAWLTVWGITAALGEHYIFRINVLIMAAVAAAGVLCVRLAAAIPLRKAARIPPMQAIRNVELTRRLKQSRVKSRLLFDVPRHIARRQITLYRPKQAGIASMLAVSIVLLSLVFAAAGPLLNEAAYDYGADYVLWKLGEGIDWLMEYEYHRPGITEQDRADAAALAGVKTVIGEKVLRVKILIDRITPYLTGTGNSYWDFGYLSPEAQEGDPLGRQWEERQYRDYLASKAKYGYTQDYLSVDCCATAAAVVEKLAPFVSAGSINLDKINAGAEILLVAPAEYGIMREEWDDGSLQTTIHYQLDPAATYSAVYQNDLFRAGDAITVSLLYTDDPDPWQYNDDGSRKLPEAVRLDRTVTIGAILEPRAGEQYLSSYFNSPFQSRLCSIITTTAGLQALGFDLPYRALAVTLDASPDAATEEYLENTLAQIAARTEGVRLVSYVAVARENRQIARGLLIAAGAVLLLFFTICASMINNSLAARIRAGRREIGTLRAVGASEREIMHSFLWQLLSIFAWGTAIGLVAALALCGWLLVKGHLPAGETGLPLWQPLLAAAILFGLCYLNLRSRVGAILKESVVENIREL